MRLESYSDDKELYAGISSVLDSGESLLLHTPEQDHQSVMDFARSVSAGLRRTPRQLECRFLYDARGSALYDQICVQPEYYPTRTELHILRQHAAHIARLTGPVTMVELGAGSALKAEVLLNAYLKGQRSVRYIPIDVSAAALRQAGNDLGRGRKGVQVIGIQGVYARAFPLFENARPLLVLFLGSTLGNMSASEADAFWADVATHLLPGDFFLLGVDLVKDPDRLERAYNDVAGVSAAFTKNMFVRMNRELGSHVELDAVQHVATYNPERRRVEIRARFSRPQTIEVAPLGEVHQVAAGEEILTEISRKFVLAHLVSDLARHGLLACEAFTDPQRDFATLLLRKAPARGGGGGM